MYRHLIILLLVVFLPLAGLMKPGLPQTHDGRDHVARIANFYQSLSEGNFVPRWAGNLNWGYGHPILMFLYPFPSYASSLIHFLGFDLIDSVKLFFGISYVLSAVFMYLWLRREVGEAGGVAGALLYVFAPYRFVDFYVRGAIGEHAAFAFFPLLMLGIYRLTEKTSRQKAADFLLLSVSVCLLILSHNALSLMFFPVAILYVFWRLSKVKYHRSLTFGLLSSVLIGFGLSSFFWIPAFVEGKYTLRDIVTQGEFAARYVSVADFFRPVWNYGQADTLPKQLGVVQWFMVFASVYLASRKKTDNRLVTGWALGLLLLSLLVQTGLAAPVWEHVSLLQKFQFPWRFLSLSVFLAAAIGGLTVSGIEKKYSNKKSIGFVLIGIIFFGLAMTTFRMWFPKGYLTHPESFYTAVFPSTTDTGESSPIWSVRFMEAFPETKIAVIEGSAEVTELARTSVIRRYRVISEGALILENTLYFPNWQVFVDGVPADIEFQDPAYRGLITFTVPAGNHEVLVQFGKTKVRTVAELLSVASGAVLIAVSLYLWKRKSV